MTPLILLPLYALADRFAGGGWPALDAKLPGRSVFWAALVLAGVGWLTAGPFGALSALVWFIYRTPGWDVFGGSMTPSNAHQVIGTFLRHVIPAPLLALVAYWTGFDPIRAAVDGVLFALSATFLAVMLAKAIARHKAQGEPEGAENTYVELCRGLAFGAVVAALVIVQ